MLSTMEKKDVLGTNSSDKWSEGAIIVSVNVLQFRLELIECRNDDGMEICIDSDCFKRVVVLMETSKTKKEI